MFGLTTEQIALILAALLAISEVLASIPSIQANSIFQILVGIIKKFSGK